MKHNNNIAQILPAEWVGKAAHDKNGMLTIGTGDKVVKLYLNKGTMPRWWKDECVDVYVRRFAHDLSICEIMIAQHDGYAVEETQASCIDEEEMI